MAVKSREAAIASIPSYCARPVVLFFRVSQHVDLGNQHNSALLKYQNIERFLQEGWSQFACLYYMSSLAVLEQFEEIKKAWQVSHGW